MYIYNNINNFSDYSLVDYLIKAIIGNTNVNIQGFSIVWLDLIIYIGNKYIYFELKNIAFISDFYLNIISAL